MKENSLRLDSADEPSTEYLERVGKMRRVNSKSAEEKAGPVSVLNDRLTATPPTLCTRRKNQSTVLP